MTQRLRSFLKDQYATTAAEFALVLPLVVLFLLGTIDVGRYMWTVNKAEKATQMGARFAIVTAPVPSGLAGYSFTGTIAAGQPVLASAYGKMTCGATTKTVAATCTCSGNCPWGAAAATTAPATPAVTPFDKIYERIKIFLPEVERQHLKIEYAPSGLGYSGDPTGPDIYPVITVKLQGIQFKPIALFNTININVPSSAFALTMEDGVGATSN